MDIFDDARDDVDDPVEPEHRVDQIGGNSPVHQPQEALQAQNAAPIDDEPVHNEQHARQNRCDPQRNRSRSRSRSPAHNPHENSKYSVM